MFSSYKLIATQPGQPKYHRQVVPGLSYPTCALFFRKGSTFQRHNHKPKPPVSTHAVTRTVDSPPNSHLPWREAARSLDLSSNDSLPRNRRRNRSIQSSKPYPIHEGIPMTMAASVLAAAAASPQLTSRRWAPLVASHPRANPPPALRLRAPASPLRASVPRDSCAGAAVPRAPCAAAAAALGGGVKAEATERVAADWDVLKRVALLALGCCAAAAALGCCAARAAAEDSIKASGFGLRVAESLRRLGWPDDAVVFALATLPVIELRGAIPVGYWLRLHPVRLTILSVLGFVLFINPPSSLVFVGSFGK